jgi:hypothetical protein
MQGCGLEDETAVFLLCLLKDCHGVYPQGCTCACGEFVTTNDLQDDSPYSQVSWAKGSYKSQYLTW